MNLPLHDPLPADAGLERSPDLGLVLPLVRRGPNLAWLMEHRGRARSAPSRLSRSLAAACGLLAVVFLASVVLVPRIRREIAVRVIAPEPVRTLIEEPILEPPPLTANDLPPLEQLNVNRVADPPAAESEAPIEAPLPRARREEPLDPERGRAGRARAETATAALTGATAALDRALDGLTGGLRDARAAGDGARDRRGRRVRGGRGETDLGAVDATLASSSAPGIEASVVRGSRVSIPAVTGSAPSSPDGTPDVTARSNASLLAVIQKYAPGIQYCYGTVLKRDPSLRGKVVFSITVAAAGTVQEARVAENTVGSPELVSCALAQIRDWRFPAAAGGAVTFQAPFVFTPPNE